MKTAPKAAIILQTWHDCDRALSSLLVADTLRRKLQAELDGDIQDLRQRYERDDPADPGKISIERFAAQGRALRAAIESFAFIHRADFGDAKTRALADGSLQLRLGNPALRLLSRKWSWDSVLDALRAAAARGRKLVAGWLRIREEIEKPAILAAYRDGDAHPEDLAEFGLRVDQTESIILRDREGTEIP